jgi:hypothetical protein
MGETTSREDLGEGIGEYENLRNEEYSRSLLCVAVGVDPKGREHRIKVRASGTSFALVDSRRRCRVEARRFRRPSEADIALEIAFVFRVRVNSFEYPGRELTRENRLPRRKGSKSPYWSRWVGQAHR